MTTEIAEREDDVDIELLLETVGAFAADAEKRLFAEESADGDLDAVDGLLADAASIGLLADVDDDAGHFGVWGQYVDEGGVALSLAALRRIGRVCAGLATAIHAQGIGVRFAGPNAGAALAAGARVAAAFAPPYGVALDPRTQHDGIRVVDGRLHGRVRFALSAGQPGAVAVLANPDTIVCLPVDTPGLQVSSVGQRIGLRAVTMVDVVATAVPFSIDDSAEADALPATTALDWLGQAAIALGCAERATEVARDYAASRVQGGVAIREHAAVRLLLNRAEYDVSVLAAVLERHPRTPLPLLDPDTLLRWAIDARLAAGEHAARAITDSLQVLGGYGYMDEYGMSKRLRDVTALRVLHGNPDQLTLLREQTGGAA